MANTADPPVNLTAMQRFLAVYKLVEDLLLNLDSRTLNFSKRVCRAWRDLIDGSDAIKEVYLMVPEPYLGQRQFRRPVRPVRRRNTLFNWPGRWLRAWLPRWFPRRHVRWAPEPNGPEPRGRSRRRMIPRDERNIYRSVSRQRRMEVTRRQTAEEVILSKSDDSDEFDEDGLYESTGGYHY